MPLPLQKDMARRQLGGAPAQKAEDVLAPPGAAPQQAAPAAQRPAGTGFVSLQRLLEANRPQAERMAQGVLSGVEGRGEAARGAIQAGQQKFAKATADNTLKFEQKNAQSAAVARGFAGREYAGPKDWDEVGVDTQGLASQAAKAGDEAGALTSQGGIASLIQDGMGRRLPTGSVAMDSALAGSLLGGRAQAAKDAYGGLSEMLAKARGGASGMYDAAREKTGAAAKRYGEWTYRLEEKERRASEDAAARDAAGRPVAVGGNVNAWTPGVDRDLEEERRRREGDYGNASGVGGW